MRNQQTRMRKSSNSFRVILIVFCLSLTAAVSAATVCKTYRLEVPDPADLKLKDGEHVIAAVATDNGRLEARVTVKGGVASQPRYYIGGRLFEKTPESNVPADIRECLKSAQRAQKSSLPSRGLLSSVGSPALSWVAPVDKKPKCVVLSSDCGKRVCWATVCCQVGAFADCGYASAIVY